MKLLILNYFLSNLKITWLRLIEFKMNLYGAIIEQIFYYIGYFIFFLVIFNNFSDVINWTLGDFLLFMIIIDIIHVTQGIFEWKMSIKDSIIKGYINLYLSKPVNIFAGYTLSNLSTASYFFLISNIILLPIVIIYYNIELFNIALSFFIFIIITLLTLITGFFINSINFVSFGLSDVINNIEHIGTAQVAKSFPYQFFKESAIKYFMFAFPLFFIGSLLIPIIRNYPILNIEIQISILVTMIITLSILTYINWHLGLKRYSAYG